ncbi:bile acid:sodium symporter [Luteolibacter pohnpeiensis]|uniref:Bile acid:sodium symporter n=1 Tax=Luteolibacter pohnpeiensis TaxID=454153 RepID=A0A934VXT2_9BACT|nr:bile acid:sodium symporter family protein [Luteolibacter pohnpeiensis]MBK1884183.1 bile acid:sodium symporter [Luteolibacter pohnpeiensis]
MSDGSPSSPHQISWIRKNGFLVALFSCVAAAFVFPQGGARDGVLNPDLINNGGIALILFLQGLSLAFEKIRSGAGNWRLHLVIQIFTFVIFPLVGSGLNALVPWLWKSEPQAIRDGFLFLCVLPSTVSTSVVLTAVARGNTPGALFNAALSNVLGVVFTPLLVHWLMTGAGTAQTEFGPLLLKIVALTLVPFALGMILRPWLKNVVDRRKIWVTRISNTVIIFMVYCAFCESVVERVWSRYGAGDTLLTALFVLLLFTGMSLLIRLVCIVLRMPREDSIAAYFCAVKKTLVMGVPLAAVIFGPGGELSLILLPLMMFHPLQLFVNSLLATRWAEQ